MDCVHVETRRLRLRSLRPEDLPWMVWLHGDPEVMRYIRAPDSPQFTRRRLDELLDKQAKSKDFGCWPAEAAGVGVIGWFVLIECEWGPDFEVGYRLFSWAWGHGFATEGTLGLVERARELRLPRLVAMTHPDNRASQRVLHKADFANTGPGFAYGQTVTCFERRVID